MPLYPEEAEGDRMIHQLNFIPPHVPHNQDSADIPLKKILFWTGAGGRVVVYRKQNYHVFARLGSEARKRSVHQGAVSSVIMCDQHPEERILIS